jgi:hypothetical protein
MFLINDILSDSEHKRARACRLFIKNITVAPKKLIWPQSKIYPIKTVAIINKKITTPLI